MFWLYGNKINHIDDLVGHSIASYHSKSPPAGFLNIMLRQLDINPSTDVNQIPVSDGLARLEQLRQGSVRAGLFSSAFPPTVFDNSDLSKLAFIGNHVSLPTTGLAVHEQVFEEQHDLVEVMGSVFTDALKVIHTDKRATEQSLEEHLTISSTQANRIYQRIQSLFSRTGKVDATELHPEIELVAKEFETTSGINPTEMYLVWLNIRQYCGRGIKGLV